MKKNLFFISIFLVVLLLFSGFFWLYEAKFLVGRASVTSASFSIENSYIFLTPLRAKADNKEKIRLTVFVLNNQGLGVLGKSVIIGQDPNLKIEGIQIQTDSYGKAIFDIAASKPGDYFLEVKVDGQILPQKAHLSFN